MSADRTALLDAFRRRFGRPARLVAEAPGRVNLIGEHTDYNEGHVLPLAIDRTVAVAAAPQADAEPVWAVHAYSLDYDEDDSFSLAEIRPLPEGGWRNYVRGVAWALREAGHGLRGLQLALSGDVPIGAGLSSSAALEVAVAAAFAAASEIPLDPRDLALLAQRSENDFVGVQCGIMDQLVAVFGQPDHVLLIDCRSLDVEPVPLSLDEQGIAVVSSTPRCGALWATRRITSGGGSARRRWQRWASPPCAMSPRMSWRPAGPSSRRSCIAAPVTW
jgi:galactokinase